MIPDRDTASVSPLLLESSVRLGSPMLSVRDRSVRAPSTMCTRRERPIGDILVVGDDDQRETFSVQFLEEIEDGRGRS